MELLSFITHAPIFLLSFATKSRTRQHIFTSYHRFELANSTLSPTLFFHSAVERIGAHRRQVPKPVPRAITISRWVTFIIDRNSSFPFRLLYLLLHAPDSWKLSTLLKYFHRPPPDRNADRIGARGSVFAPILERRKHLMHHFWRHSSTDFFFPPRSLVPREWESEHGP